MLTTVASVMNDSHMCKEISYRIQKKKNSAKMHSRFILTLVFFIFLKEETI